MRDDRKYRILLRCGVGSVWVRDVSHNNFINGIQNGGLKYWGDKRHAILDFQIQAAK